MESRPVPYLHFRLSVLIFLAFAILGAWLPVFSLHLKNLGFSPEATAWASSANAIGALLAPIIWGQIADRWLSMDRCIFVTAIVSGLGLFALAELSDPGLVIAMCIAIWLFLIPVVGLTAACVFRQLDHPDRDYGWIRVWGTIGWVATGWMLTGLLEWWTPAGTTADYADSLRLGGAASFAMAVYALTLPNVPPKAIESAAARSWIGSLIDAPLRALKLFGNRSYVIYSICMFGMNVTLPFTIQLNPLLLKKLEVSEGMTPLYLTASQSTEVLFLFLLPFLLQRFGMKPVMLAGALSWTAGLGVLSVGEPVEIVLASFVTHGVFICCFFIAGQVFVNRLATHDIRASAQGILLFISGSGLLVGHLLVGWLRSITQENFTLAFGCGAGVAGTMMILFLVGFSGPPREPEIDPQEAPVPH